MAGIGTEIPAPNQQLMGNRTSFRLSAPPSAAGRSGTGFELVDAGLKDFDLPHIITVEGNNLAQLVFRQIDLGFDGAL